MLKKCKLYGSENDSALIECRWIRVERGRANDILESSRKEPQWHFRGLELKESKKRLR